MAAYQWNGRSFELPAGLVDQTAVTLVDDPARPSYSLTIAVDKKGAAPFARWVEAQLADLARAVPGYASLSRSDSEAQVTVAHRVRGPQGQPMRQRQAYVDVGDAFAIVTLTCADAPNDKADDAFAQIARSLR
ncbi:MAG TPA: DcrB-related protein [Myxococcota bacterium]|jgi:hypothetical protein